MEQKKISWYSHIRWGCIIYHYSDTATLIGNLGMIFVFMGGMRLLAAAGGLEIIWNLEDILFCLTGILGLFMLYVAYRLNDRAKKRYDEEHGTLTEQFEAVKNRNLASDKPVGNASRKHAATAKVRGRTVRTILQSFGAERITLRSGPCWMLNGVYFRLSVLKLPSRTFLVIKWTDNIEAAGNNVFEKIQSFPWDLDDEEFAGELKHVLYGFI